MPDASTSSLINDLRVLVGALQANTKAQATTQRALAGVESALVEHGKELVENGLELVAHKKELARNTLATVANTAAVENHTAKTAELVELLAELLDVLKPLPEEGPPNPVGPLTARQTGEDENMLIYELDLPQLPEVPAAADATHGEVVLNFDGVDQAVIQTTIGQLVVTDVKIPQGAVVNGSFTFVDDAGLKSVDPTELTEFTASDTIPPPDPVGGFGARQVGEE